MHVQRRVQCTRFGGSIGVLDDGFEISERALATG